LNDSRTASFEALYDAYYRRVYAYLLGHVGDKATAEDLLQETFLRAWRHINETPVMAPQRRAAWLFTVARNLLHDQHRRQTARTRAELLLAADVSIAATDPEEAHNLRELVASADLAISRLPPEQRIALTLQVVGGMSSREIADALGRPPGTVRYQLSRARASIAKALSLLTEVTDSD
jgi:RNA polymerase sigma-70 factor (ECF subfamily)